ncbi:MAG: hypothetical protein KDC05_03875, partial [Bacteroidales bacterium]|nr:hypothetical protein [Bacteroidales bacterium]
AKWYVGGFIGHISGSASNISLSNCYSSGNVIQSDNLYYGPFAGRLYDPLTTINYCYYDSDNAGVPDNGIAVGRTSAEMTVPHDASTYETWDFTSLPVWKENIWLNEGYPYLSCQNLQVTPISVFPHCESFDDPQFPPYGWTNLKTGGPSDPGTWSYYTSGTNPTCSPHSGAGMAGYNCWNYNAGTTGILAIRPVNFPGDNYMVSFWMYRNGTGSYYSYPDSINVYYNTSPEATGGTLLGTIYRYTQLPPIVTNDGWYYYEFYMPSGVAGNISYVIFEAVSEFGNRIFLDDICLDEIPTLPPNCAIIDAPANGETNVSVSTSLSWLDGGAGTTGYRLYFGTDNPPTNIINGDDLGSVLNYNLAGMLSSDETYYWKVVPYNNIGEATGCPVWSFTTTSFIEIDPQPSWQTTTGSFGIGGSIIYKIPMKAGFSYNFSICDEDGVGAIYQNGSNGDFTLYSDENLISQVWHIDGPGSCDYNASTLGTSYEDFSPSFTQYYYLLVDDWSGGSANFILAYQGNFIILPDFTGHCQSVSVPASSNGAPIFYRMELNDQYTYNFSTCDQDLCAGDSPANDADFNFYTSDLTYLWYIDGKNSCFYNASTYGTIFENYSPPSSGPYFLQIDDFYGDPFNSITLAYIEIRCGGANAFPYVKNFDAGIVPPNCWTETVTNNTDNWQYESYSSCAFCPGGDYPQNEWLITESFDFSAEISPLLSFKWNAFYDEMVTTNKADFNCKISTDEGLTWAQLWSEEDEGYFDWSFYKTKMIDLSDYAGEASVKIGFQFVTYQNIANAVFLDDFTITSNSLVNLQPMPWWQTINGSFTSGSQKVYSLPLVAERMYNFSICINDDVGSSYAGSGNGDLSLYADVSLSNLVWTIDGATECSYNATTLGTMLENFIPSNSQNYFLVVNDHTGTNDGSYVLAYQGNFIEIPTITQTCQTTLIPGFDAGSGVYCKIQLDQNRRYNFSTCSLDECAGEAPGNDADFTMYSPYGTLYWNYDGPAACDYDATTIGSSYEDFAPPYDGGYFLFIDDFYENAGTGIILAYSYTVPVTALASPTVCEGELVEVPVTVNDFNNIGGLSLTVNYDPAMLSFNHVQLHADIATANAEVPNEGEFRLAWFSLTGIDLPDDETLFTLIFDYAGPTTGGTVDLTWPDTPAELNEYSDPQGNVYPTTPFGDYFVDGTVTIQEQPTIEAGPDQYICADVISVTMTGYSFAGATGAFWSGGNGSWTGDEYSPTTGEIATGSVVLFYTTNTAFPCPEISDDVTLYFNPLPVVSSVSMQARTDATGPPWNYLVSGDLTEGYSMCIVPAVTNYYLDVNTLFSSPALQDGILNPFYLNGIYPQSFFDYWALKGVDGGGPYGDWRDQMWLIINGNAPFFYIKLSGGDYKLVDGLMYHLYGNEPVLTVPGDYPANAYSYSGTVTDVNGCESIPFLVDMDFKNCDINGILRYNNSPQTGIEGMTVTLNCLPAVSGNTGSDGAFTLPTVPSGTYSVTVNDNDAAHGGINATDAAMVNYWGVSPWNIEKVRFFAGDVSGEGNADALDALQILAYFVNGSNPAFDPDWKFWLSNDLISSGTWLYQDPQITIGSGSTSLNLYGLCTGDFNQSFIPGSFKNVSGSIVLHPGKEIFAAPGSEIGLPVYATG